MKNGVLEKGEHAIRLSLPYNAFDFLQCYDEQLNSGELTIQRIKMALLSCICFYETFFKFVIIAEEGIQTIVESSDIVSNDRLKSGAFRSINFNKCLEKMVAKGAITKEEKELITRHELIRNSIVHYEITGDYEFFGSNVIVIKEEEFDFETKIIGSLLSKYRSILPKHLAFEYEKLINKFTDK